MLSTVLRASAHVRHQDTLEPSDVSLSSMEPPIHAVSPVRTRPPPPFCRHNPLATMAIVFKHVSVRVDAKASRRVSNTIRTHARCILRQSGVIPPPSRTGPHGMVNTIPTSAATCTRTNPPPLDVTCCLPHHPLVLRVASQQSVPMPLRKHTTAKLMVIYCLIALPNAWWTLIVRLSALILGQRLAIISQKASLSSLKKTPTMEQWEGL